MAWLRTNEHGKKIWPLEKNNSDSPLSEQLEELQQVFNYYTRNKEERTNTDFIMSLMAIQTTQLAENARLQEKKFTTLCAEVALLKKDLAQLKNPPPARLDKAKPDRPAPPGL